MAVPTPHSGFSNREAEPSAGSTRRARSTISLVVIGFPYSALLLESSAFKVAPSRAEATGNAPLSLFKTRKKAQSAYVPGHDFGLPLLMSIIRELQAITQCHSTPLSHIYSSVIRPTTSRENMPPPLSSHRCIPAVTIVNATVRGLLKERHRARFVGGSSLLSELTVLFSCEYVVDVLQSPFHRSKVRIQFTSR